jgi:hypothetical protein
MRLSVALTTGYDRFQGLGAVFFDVFNRWCSQMLSTGYHSAFNYSVHVDR